MIAEIKLKNFKRFRNLHLHVKNLTVMTGANGSGKTSVFHSLLLARQMSRQSDKRHVELNGVDNLELGTVEDVINRDAGDESASIVILDDSGVEYHWLFRAGEGTEIRMAEGIETRMLNAIVVERPYNYNGALSKSAPSFCYLCAERLGPRDTLGASATNISELDVGSRGEYVAQVLATYNRSRVSSGRMESSNSKSQLADLLHQTERWMGRIARPTQIDTEWLPHTSVIRMRFKTPGFRTEWTRTPNTGFGISYALPVIVAALRAQTGGLLLVENPEAHLHPVGQSRIGGFLAQVAADGVQVFVETHSDHVLNGIRLAVAERSATLLPEQVVIHFFQGDNEGELIQQSINIAETGQLSSWPPGFFDQTQLDLAALASKRHKRS